MSRKRNRFSLKDHICRISRNMRLADPKTDVFLAANVVDAVLTYLILQHGVELTEFNSILSAVMDKIGIGPTMLLKVVVCLFVLWTLRTMRKERLLVPLSLALVAVAINNYLVARAYGIEI